ncbi:putative two-component response regulator [Amycolatopsis camponoti]|uniref:Putative two-component response regulator n=1 Tax=Amycolatopsis camponoti TaxID=2606593 RepID=A0A6I8LZ11_9PSEU|nr:putative two-component response regulator [Amycolatopsis camponoti]
MQSRLARGFLPKAVDAEDLLIAIKTAAGGGAYVSVMVAEMIVEDHADWPMTAGEVEPSPRDEQVMQLLATGERDVDIALIFDIGVRTVLGYLDRIRDKTGVRRRPDLVKTAV